MTSREKAIDYYHRVIQMGVNAHAVSINDIAVNDLIEAFTRVIEANNEYLLTDAVLYFIAYKSDKENVIELINSLTDKEKSIYFMFKFFNSIPNRLHDYYFKYLNEYEKKYYQFMMSQILNNKLIDKIGGFAECNLFLNIIIILISMAVIDQKEMDNFKIEYEAYLNDGKNKIDEILMQDLCGDYKPSTARDVYKFDIQRLIHYIFIKENENRKEIR